MKRPYQEIAQSKSPKKVETAIAKDKYAINRHGRIPKFCGRGERSFFLKMLPSRIATASSIRRSSNILQYKKPIFFTPAKPPPPIPVDTEAIENLKRSFKVWRGIFYFICLPCIALSYYNGYYVAPPPKRLKRHDWDFLNAGNSNFAWGDGKHTLFFNKYVNSTKDGYETTDEEFLEWRKKHYGR
ncbi:hypothetical protein ACOME3_004043 [Neoechinorhynchus agilis]